MKGVLRRSLSRRHFLSLAGAACATVTSSVAGSAQESGPQNLASEYALTVTLLGTGGPELGPDRRQGAATLVQAGSELLLFDAGRGVMQRLYDSGVPVPEVRQVFLTHLHSDHIVGLPELWITPWFMAGRKGPMRVFGPKGTEEMLLGIRAFLASDIRHRPSPFNPASELTWEPHEFEGSAVIYQSGNLTVRSVPVDHKEGNPAFGFVVQYGPRKIVLSGDCTLSEELIREGKGADLVIHNVYAPSPELLSRDENKRIVAQKLATPEQAGEVLRRMDTRYAVFSHVILLDSTPAMVLQRTRAAGYHGPLLIGEDLMKVVVGDSIDVIL